MALRHKGDSDFSFSQARLMSFGLFVLKVGLLHLDSIYPMLQSELEVSSVATEFGMLAMIFFAFITK